MATPMLTINLHPCQLKIFNALLVYSNEIRILKEELQKKTNLELDSFKEKIKLNKQLPYLVSNIVEEFFGVYAALRLCAKISAASIRVIVVNSTKSKVELVLPGDLLLYGFDVRYAPVKMYA
ncbi:hypothetical protein Tco_1299252, partial [Tanacetum coccineum]